MFTTISVIAIVLLAVLLWLSLTNRLRPARLKSAETLWLQAQILNSVNEAVVATDLEGRITYWGPCAEKLYGHTAKDVLGKPYNECAGSVEREHTDEIKQIVLEEGSWNGEHQQQRADGSVFWSSTHISLMRNEKGDPCGFIGIDYDITERKLAEEKLAIYAAELEQNNLMQEAATAHANDLAAKAEAASIAKSEFLANMSHEIRTPMNGVIGMTTLLLDSDLNEQQERFAQMVLSSAENLLALLNDILDFSKIEAKKLDIEIVDFNLHTLMDEVQANLSVRTLEKNIELACDISPSVPSLVKGDPVRLRQVLTNLVGNAIKFTEQGGVTISVETSTPQTPDDASPAASDTDTTSLRFSVKDTGIGIPAEKRDRLFQQFSQVDGSTTRKYGGTGLGLAISKQLVELMGGAIGVDSQPGKGSEFWFVLPMARQPIDAEAQPSSAPRSALAPSTDLAKVFANRSASILLAEDNATNQQVALMLLKKMGLQADAVTDGTKVLEAIKQQKYDVILMDVQMPNMDGMAATQAIREMKNDIPIIAMTAHAMQGDRDKCLEVGMNDYVSKPISARDLAEVLDRWLPRTAVAVDEQKADVSEAGKPLLAESMVWDREGMMVRLMHDEELAKLILNSFLDDLPQLVDQLRVAFKSGTAADVELNAHSIKGAAANVGGTALSSLAKQIEICATTGQLEAAEKLAENMDAELKKLDAETRSFRESS